MDDREIEEMIRIGGPILGIPTGPDAWVAALRDAGYSAAYCPIDESAASDVISCYADAAAQADIVIAEVGVWNNPLAEDRAERAEAMKLCKQRLALAEEIGARCCVNIAGSRSTTWAGPHPKNLSEETFDMIVESVREIIDAVGPSRTYYTLETMPWVFPDSADSYLRLIEAVDREHFAVHFDPVNLIYSPRRYYDTAACIERFVNKLGPHIRSCHAKDVFLRDDLLFHLDEVPPCDGALDYEAYLQALDRLEGPVPLMIEHLSNAEEYAAAAAHIRATAERVGVRVR
jgi:sugar phosphate isomerase/epimerase